MKSDDHFSAIQNNPENISHSYECKIIYLFTPFQCLDYHILLIKEHINKQPLSGHC